MMSRSLLEVAALGTATGIAFAADSPFALPKLPYAYDALEPYIDAQTMQIHHDRHHDEASSSPGNRGLGTRLLPEVSEPEGRLPRRDSARHQLGFCFAAL